MLSITKAVGNAKWKSHSGNVLSVSFIENEEAPVI